MESKSGNVLENTRSADWVRERVSHYTGIGTEVREYKPWNFVRFTDSQGVEHCISANPDYAGTASTTCPLPDTVRVVVPLPNGLGRHALQNAAYEEPLLQGAYEFYLKDHLGSARVVYGVGYPDPLGISPNGVFRAAYDYRSFGEQLDLFVFSRKVTENFTGKELDDETELNYFGARYLDPMLGMWVSVDSARQFASPYLYAGNGVNPINGVDGDGNEFDSEYGGDYVLATFNQQRSQTNTERFLRAYNDPKRLYRFYDTKGKDGVNKIELSKSPDPNYEKTYDVYISFESYEGGINGKENFSVLTEILIGHELDHPYEFANPGHNYLDPVNSTDAYFDGIKNMSTEQNPDPIYLHDYKAADEMGVYDE